MVLPLICLLLSERMQSQRRRSNVYPLVSLHNASYWWKLNIQWVEHENLLPITHENTEHEQSYEGLQNK